MIAFHHYDLTAASFIREAQAFHAAFPGVDIWVTEVGCMCYYGDCKECDEGMAWAMMEGVMDFVNSTPWIKKVAWYSESSAPLLSHRQILH